MSNKTIGVLSVIAIIAPGSGTAGNEDARLVATTRLNAVYLQLQDNVRDMGMTCRTMNVTHVKHGNFYAKGEMYSVVEAIGVFESELYSTQAELEAIRKDLGFQSLGQHIREGE